MSSVVAVADFGGIRSGKTVEHVVERAILLHDDHDVLDRARRRRRASRCFVESACWAAAAGRAVTLRRRAASGHATMARASRCFKPPLVIDLRSGHLAASNRYWASLHRSGSDLIFLNFDRLLRVIEDVVECVGPLIGVRDPRSGA